MTMYIGLDVHCKRTMYVAQDGRGKVLGQGSIPTTPEGLKQLIQTLGAPARTTIGLETGAQATWVYRHWWPWR